MIQERDTRLPRIEDMIRRLLRRKADSHLSKALEKMHVAEVAQIFSHLIPEERRDAFHLVSTTSQRAAILTECDAYIIRELLDPLPNEEIARLIQETDSDDARYLLDALPEERSADVVEVMDASESKAIEEVLAYPPDSAGSIMTDSYVALNENLTVEEAIAQVRKASEGEYVFYVYVVDENQKIRGVVSLRQLLLADQRKNVSEVMTANVWSVNVHADQEDVARMVSRYNILAIPVIDVDSVLVGIVTVDDVIDVLREEATEDFLKMAGTHYAEEITSLPAMRLAWVRFPWLLISWVGSLAAAVLISQFSSELSKVIALAAFIPVINGTAGNVGSQSVVIMIRGLATGKVDPKAWVRIMGKQALVGLMLGVCFGLMVFLIAAYQFPSVTNLGFIVGIAIFASMTFSATAATAMPLILHSLRLDPALMTGPFLTSSVDLVSVLIYFNIARYFLAS
jgi:magnesium transporter